MGKRKPSKREPNGRLSRRVEDVIDRNKELLADLDREERSTLSVGMSARARVLGVKPHQLRDQMAGCVIGRWCLEGSISRVQYDAAMAFLESHHRNLLAIDAPKQPGAVNLNATRGRPVGLENADQMTKWRQQHKAALDAIQDKQNEIRLQGNLYGALYEVVVRDQEFPHLQPSVRTACNALAKYYALEARMAA